MVFALTFAYVSPEATYDSENDYIPLLDGYGREVTMTVDAPSRTAAYNYDPYVENFCRDQGNDCRVREVR